MILRSSRLLSGLAICLLLSGVGRAEWVVRVGPSRGADTPSLAEALALVAGKPGEAVTLEIENGFYFGHFVVDRPDVTLRGQGAFTVLSGNLGQAMPGAAGEALTWRGAATLLLTPRAVNCRVETLTVENTYGKGMQAQAVSSEGDRVLFRDCRILGWQDTLRVDVGRHFFDRCYISGHVDFIYGSATALFERCEIFSRDQGYIVAPSTPEGQAGFVFTQCILTAPYGNPLTYLGRPWRESPHAVFISCEMGKHIRPEGWKEWNVPPEKVRFSEYQSSGPGAASAVRVVWAQTSPSSAPPDYLRHQLLRDWTP